MFTRDPQFDRMDDILKQVPAAPPLAPPEGKVVRVSTPWEIIHAIEDAEEHTTILIAKGRYVMPRDCILNTHYVCIRGETGNRDDVILDGDTEFNQKHIPLGTRMMSGGDRAPSIIKLIRCRHVCIADLTVANSPKYGIMFIGDGRVNNLTIYNVKFHNIWARGLKGTGPFRIDHMPYTKEELGYDPMADEHLQWNRPRHGRVQYCLFVNDHPKRDLVDPDEGNYICGLDLMALQDWVIADNAFVGMRGASGRGRGAVFIWVLSEDVVVENNLFIHCDKAISLGNPSGRQNAHHIKNAVVKNNTIVGGCNKAIEIQHGDNVEIHNNRICSFDRKEYHAIQVLDIVSQVQVHDNIIQKDALDAFNVGEHVTVGKNVVDDLSTRFVDVEVGDLSLK